MSSDLQCPQSNESPAKPAIAARLEAESAALAQKRAELTPEKLEQDLKAADDRRAAVLNERVEKAKELEGSRSRDGSPKRELAKQ